MDKERYNILLEQAAETVFEQMLHAGSRTTAIIAISKQIHKLVELYVEAYGDETTSYNLAQAKEFYEIADLKNSETFKESMRQKRENDKILDKLEERAEELARDKVKRLLENYIDGD